MASYFKLFLISSIMLLAACQEGGEAGDLQGQWKMDGSESKFMALSGSVTVFRYIIDNKLSNEIYGNFQRAGDSLFIQCHSVKGEAYDTLIIETKYGFKPFNNIRLKVETLDTDKLILSKSGQIWSFEKY